MLRPEDGGPYWDLTLGTGGHLEAFLGRAPDGTAAFGLDGDPAALDRCRARLGPGGAGSVTLAHGDLGTLAGTEGWPRPRAVLLDLGLSSPQVDDASRGFSYRHDGPLDMRMDPSRGPTAAEWLIDVSQKDLERALRDLGEERFAGRIARVIKEAVPIQTTTQLCAVVAGIVPVKGRHHPARRTFQAIRIAVNRELERVESGLGAACDALLPGGVVAVLSYHSGEDRVAKNVLRDRKRVDLELLTKKPIACSEAEAATNPRARSAKLRAARKRD